MINSGIRYYVEAEFEEYIVSFSIEVVNFRKLIKRDIIAKFNYISIHVNDKMTSEDVVGEYYRLMDINN